MRTVAFYISGHGFGHASRQIEIINALASRVVDVRILLRTSVPRWLLERTIKPAFLLFPAPSDTGIVQIDSLKLDPKATMERAREFYAAFDRQVETEGQLLGKHRVAFVVSDAPPLACSAAVAAGIQSVVVANFTWDWIYEEYRECLPSAPDVILRIRDAYAQAEAAWRLPLHGGFKSFSNIVDVPFVARHARHAREETRAAFRLPQDLRIALASFGGYGVEDLPLQGLDCRATWGIALTGSRSNAAAHYPGVHVIEDDQIYAGGFRYEDLVHACDAVITKPGYGIVSECLANGPALVYTSRGHFAEYPVMVAQMPRFLRCAYLSNEDLFAGRWLRALEDAVDAAAPPERPATNGAEVIADMIAARLCF